jgi:uncharacterized protein
MDETIKVEVAYALPERQWLRTVVVPVGVTVAYAISASGLADEIPDLALDPARIGIFGNLVSPDTLLREGDRVEIYRPLQIDPKESRRRRAQASDND